MISIIKINSSYHLKLIIISTKNNIFDELTFIVINKEETYYSTILNTIINQSKVENSMESGILEGVYNYNINSLVCKCLSPRSLIISVPEAAIFPINLCPDCFSNSSISSCGKPVSVNEGYGLVTFKPIISK